MKAVHISKSVGNGPTQQFTVPGPLINAANRVLPKAALVSLARKGVDMEKIAYALKSSEPYRSVLEVHERGVRTTVLIAVGE